LPLEKIEDLDRCFEIAEERMDLLMSTPDRISMEIASSFEIRKFVLGEAEFKELASEKRHKQLAHIINVIEKDIPNLQIRVLEAPIYNMSALYGSENVTIRSRDIYFAIPDKRIGQLFSENFNSIWQKCLSSEALIDYLKAQRDSIPK